MRAHLVPWAGALRASLFAALLGAAFAPAAARAEPVRAEPARAEQAQPSALELERARAAFAEGRALMDQRNWAAAAAKFRDAAGVKNTPGLRYHIALCEENAGRVVEAETEYLIARGLLAEQPAEDVAALIAPALERIEQATPRLRLVMPSGVSNARVELDGRALAEAELRADLRVNPGRHQLRVEALGHEPFALEFEARPSEVQSIAVRLAPRQPAPAAEPAVGTRDRFGWRTATLIGTATLSAAGLGVGIWGLIERSSAAERVGRHEATVRERAGYLEGACSGPGADLTATCADLEQALDDQDRATAFAVGGLVTTLTGLAATTATLLFWREEGVVVQASIAPERGALTVSGRY